MGTGAEYYLFQFALVGASTAYQQKKMRKMKRQQEAARDKMKGQKFTIRGEASPLPVIYGKQINGGIAVKHKVNSSYTSATLNSDNEFQTNFSNSTQSGSKNEFLMVQYALCHEGIEGVEHILIDDIDYRGYTKDMKDNNAEFIHRFHVHNNGGAADAAAVLNGAASTDTFTGAANVTAFYKLNRDNPQYNGSPGVSFLVKGRKVRNIIRSGTGTSNDPYTYALNSTYTYSNNPAYVLLDYLTNSSFGRGLSDSYIDLESFYNSAQICDTTVMFAASVAGQVNSVKPIFSYADYNSFPQTVEPYQTDHLFYAEDTSTLYSMTQSNGTPTYTVTTAPERADIKLYEANLTLDPEASLRDNVEAILNTMGDAGLTWTPDGKYKLLLNYPTSLSETEALIDSNHTFTEDDIIRNEISVSWPTATERFNQVTVQFDNEYENFKADSATWPPYSNNANDPYQVYLTADNNQPLRNNVTGIGITDPYHAKALAEQMVRQSRFAYKISFTATKKGLTVEVGDIIKVNMPSMSISNEIFKVEKIQVSDDFSVKIDATYFNHENLAWNISDDAPYGVLADIEFKLEAPTNASFSDTTNDVLGTASGKLTWAAVDDIAVKDYLIEISVDNGTTWRKLGSTANNSFDVTGLKTNVYDFSIRSRDIRGNLSSRTLVENETIQLTTVGAIKAIYADDASGTNKSETWTGQEYVLYYEYDSDFDINNVTGTWARFIGDDGDRGAGWWRYVDTTNGTTYYYNFTTSTVNQTNVDAAFSTAVGLDKKEGDRLVIKCTNNAIAFIYSSSAWVYQDAFLDGNLLVNGTVTANELASDAVTTDKLAANSITSAKIAASQTISSPVIDGGIIRGAVIEAGILVAQIEAFAVNQNVSTSIFADAAEKQRAATVKEGSLPKRIVHEAKYTYTEQGSGTKLYLFETDKPLNINQDIPASITDYNDDLDLLKRNWHLYVPVQIDINNRGTSSLASSHGYTWTGFVPQIKVRVYSPSLGADTNNVTLTDTFVYLGSDRNSSSVTSQTGTGTLSGFEITRKVTASSYGYFSGRWDNFWGVNKKTIRFIYLVYRM